MYGSQGDHRWRWRWRGGARFGRFSEGRGDNGKDKMQAEKGDERVESERRARSGGRDARRIGFFGECREC